MKTETAPFCLSIRKLKYKLSQNYHFLSDFPVLNHLFNIGIPKIDFLVFLLKTGENDKCAGP